MTPFERLTQLRAAYPAIMDPAQIGALLNALAWEYRDEGMRLLGKKGGNNVPQPHTGTPISSDYLVHEPTLTGHDVLTDTASRNGIPVRFTWGPGKEDLREAIRTGARTMVAPVGGGEPLPPPEPPEPPEPPSDLEGWVHTLEARIVQLEALEREMHGQIGLQNTQAEAFDRRLGVLEGGSQAHVHRLYGLRTGGPEPVP